MSAPLASLVRVLFDSATSGGFLFAKESDLKKGLSGAATARRPTDLATSDGGSEVLCAVGDLVKLRQAAPAEEPFVRGSNAAGNYALATTRRDFKGVPGAANRKDIVSIAVRSRNRVVTAQRSGVIEADGEPVAEIPGACLVRWSKKGAIAVVAQREGASEVVILAGGESKTIEGGLPIGGVAWSPDEEKLVVRTEEGLDVYDTTGARLDRTAVAPTSAKPTSGRVAWTKRGIFALHDDHLVVAGSELTSIAGNGEAFVSLAAMQVGPYVAVTSTAKQGLTLFDVERAEREIAPRATYFLESSPIMFVPGDRALVWAEASGSICIVPFGEVETDADGAAVDAESEIVDAAAKWLTAGASEQELEDALRTLTDVKFRPSLQSRVAMVRGQLESRVRENRKAHSLKALFKKPPKDEGGFAVGDIASHKKFGDGPVTAVEGTGADAKISVAFEAGPRVLKASFLSRPE